MWAGGGRDGPITRRGFILLAAVVRRPGLRVLPVIFTLCHLPPPGGQAGCDHRGPLGLAGLGQSGMPAQGVTGILAHTHPKRRDPIPSEPEPSLPP